MVHSKSAPVDFGFLARMAEEAGASETVVRKIAEANTASQVGDMMHELGCRLFFDVMCAYCCRSLLQEAGGSSSSGFEVETVIISMKAELLGRMSMTKESGGYSVRQEGDFR